MSVLNQVELSFAFKLLVDDGYINVAHVLASVLAEILLSLVFSRITTVLWKEVIVSIGCFPVLLNESCISKRNADVILVFSK